LPFQQSLRQLAKPFRILDHEHRLRPGRQPRHRRRRFDDHLRRIRLWENTLIDVPLPTSL
jgi:hypothetical protein